MTGAATAGSAPARLRLLIVDDQPLIRRGLAMMLGAEADIEVVGQAADGVEAIEQALATRPDVVVMDLQMPRASGVVATREITGQLPGTGVVVLTTYDHDELVFEAIRAGARAYLLKDASEAEVLDTVRAVQRGESHLSPAIARKVMEQFRRFSTSGDPVRPAATSTGERATAPAGPAAAPPPRTAAAAAGRAAPERCDDPLSAKEERILELIAQGLSNKQIGATIFLAEGTVKNYVSRILEKLHARSRTELAVRAVGRRS